MMQQTILTCGGQYFNFEEPEKSHINIADIAHALSQICRFTGHTNQFYSVAQHCYLASYIVPPELAFAALMHDAAEAYIGDVAKPLKNLLPDYKKVEARVEKAVFEHFNVRGVDDPWIKRADLIMLATEQRDFMPTHDDDWFAGSDIKPLAHRINPWDSRKAASIFLMRFRDLSQVTP